MNMVLILPCRRLMGLQEVRQRRHVSGGDELLCLGTLIGSQMSPRPDALSVQRHDASPNAGMLRAPCVFAIGSHSWQHGWRPYQWAGSGKRCGDMGFPFADSVRTDRAGAAAGHCFGKMLAKRSGR